MLPPVDLLIVAPPDAGPLSGNMRTALRWQRLLADLGAAVRVKTAWEGEPCDVLIALHARKSGRSALAFRARHAERPLVVALGGTDLYEDWSQSRLPHRACAAADVIVGLHDGVAADLPRGLRPRVRIIRQSAERGRSGARARARRVDRDDGLRACVLAHLRPVKAPLLPARALRLLPETSRWRVVHAGDGTGPWVARARRAEERCARWRWLGPLPHASALRLLDECDALIVPSRSEGGANVVSEAIVRGVPILATRVPGNVGLLGSGHPGLFREGDPAALARLLRRCERDESFLLALRQASRDLAPAFTPAREKTAWRNLLAELRGRRR